MSTATQFAADTAADTPTPSDPGLTPGRRRRRRPVPYLLLAPAVLALGLMLGYPLVRLGILSVQHYGLRQQFGAPPAFVGLENFGKILSDDVFWSVLWRTIIFCAVTVALTMVVGTMVATLLNRLGSGVRTLA